MNNKERELNRIVDIVIKCCETANREIINRDLLLRGSKRENVIMTKCILIEELLEAGYTTTTCANFLGCSPQAIRALFIRSSEYNRTSRAYRLAKNEASRLIDNDAG